VRAKSSGALLSCQDARGQRACQLYIYSDLPFDIHYVNKEGNEISPTEAMKAFKQTAATKTK
jgi:hypothetical protein